MRDFWALGCDAFGNHFNTTISAPTVLSLFLFFEDKYPGSYIINYEED